MALAVNDLVQMTLLGKCGDQAVNNVIHYRVSSGTPTLLEAATGMANAWASFIAVPAIIDEYELLAVKAELIDGIAGTTPADVRLVFDGQEVYMPAAPIVGNRATTVLPLNVTVSLRKLPDSPSTTTYVPAGPPAPAFLPAKRFKGAIHVGAIAAEARDPVIVNLVEATERTAFETAAAQIEDFATAGGHHLVMVIISLVDRLSIRIDNGGTKLLAWQDVIGFHTNFHFGSQDTRLTRGWPY